MRWLPCMGQVKTGRMLTVPAPVTVLIRPCAGPTR